VIANDETKKILIVDDDRDYVSAIRSLLESAGYRVRTASNGREGVQLARVFQPDLILLDVMMTERTEGSSRCRSSGEHRDSAGRR